MKKVVLRNFSNIATPTEAAQKLRNMKMTSDQPITSYNYNYAAVHKAAFNINPSEQRMRFALEDGDSHVVDNYRPISLLMTISKILKKIFYTCVYAFITTTYQFYSSQYGFP